MKKYKLLSHFTSICFILFLFLQVLDFCCFDRNFYAKEYTKYQNAQEIGISESELMVATNVLLDYVQDNREDMIVSAMIHNTQRNVFNQREIDHMVDVKDLYLKAMMFKNGCFVVSMIIFSFIFYTKRKNALSIVLAGYRYACHLFIVTLAGLGFVAFLDFDNFWTTFHLIFFSNDLWLLNPNTDILIMMVPGGFFYDLVFKIALTFLVFLLIPYGLSLVYNRKEVNV